MNSRLGKSFSNRSLLGENKTRRFQSCIQLMLKTLWTWWRLKLFVHLHQNWHVNYVERMNQPRWDNRFLHLHYPTHCITEEIGTAVAEWLSSWLAEQEDQGSIPGLATWIFRDWLSSASKSRYGWKIAKSTLIPKTNQPTNGGDIHVVTMLWLSVCVPHSDLMNMKTKLLWIFIKLGRHVDHDKMI